MAGLVVLLAVVAVSKGQDHILQRRSPLVSLPGLDQGVLAATSSDDEDLGEFLFSFATMFSLGLARFRLI